MHANGQSSAKPFDGVPLFTRPCPFMQRKCKCPRGRACPDYHTAAQQRRDPYSHFYLPEACPMQFKGCPQGQQCKYSHTVNERQYHPILYRTLLCQTSACKKDCGVRAVCPLAHSVAEVCQPLSRTEYELGFVGGKAAAREVAEKKRGVNDMQIMGYPRFWELDLNDAHRVVKKPLTRGSEEYNVVHAQFTGVPINDGFPADVFQILRVQNPDEFDFYSLTREKVGGERWLFHGTSHERADRICSLGFDRSFSRRGAYGPGCYFGRTPAISIHYCEPDENGVLCMFLAQVAVGSSTTVQRAEAYPMVRSFEVEGGGRGFARANSVVDCGFDPYVFAVFQDHQAYPAYLIEFTVRSEKEQSGQVQRSDASQTQSSGPVQPPRAIAASTGGTAGPGTGGATGPPNGAAGGASNREKPVKKSAVGRGSDASGVSVSRADGSLGQQPASCFPMARLQRKALPLGAQNCQSGEEAGTTSGAQVVKSGGQPSQVTAQNVSVNALRSFRAAHGTITIQRKQSVVTARLGHPSEWISMGAVRKRMRSLWAGVKKRLA